MHLVAIGGSDAGISAALRARELDPTADVTVVVADAYPNFSICGIPYYISGDVTHWRNLAHRTHADLEATGMQLRLDTLATSIDVHGQRLASCRTPTASTGSLDYDELVVGTGAVPVRPPIDGLTGPSARPADGVHLLHSMGDTFALTDTLDPLSPQTALIVGAGYVGLEMAEGLTARGIAVTQVEMLPEVLPTVDPELGALVHVELEAPRRHRAHPTTVTRISRNQRRAALACTSTAPARSGQPMGWDVDLVLVVVGVRPDTDLLVGAGARTGPRGAVVVDEGMATGLPHVWAAGDCVVTHHRLLGITYLPLGTTAHKQGRVAGENALGGRATIRRQSRHPGREGLRPRRRPHRAARTRSHSGRLPPCDQPDGPRRPQGLLPGRPADQHPRHRRRHAPDSSSAHNSSVLAAPRPPNASTPTPPPCSTDDRRSDLRARPLLHPAARLPLGRRPDGRPTVGPRTPAHQRISGPPVILSG